ncbi:hypothetical protein F5884DRAFT_758804 [Xylogone sp. PMI_703]|nr:hypothetical protein F5884DRAFT_758804 [Xylogone sp. PMI_703]
MAFPCENCVYLEGQLEEIIKQPIESKENLSAAIAKARELEKQNLNLKYEVECLQEELNKAKDLQGDHERTVQNKEAIIAQYKDVVEKLRANSDRLNRQYDELYRDCIGLRALHRPRHGNISPKAVQSSLEGQNSISDRLLSEYVRLNGEPANSIIYQQPSNEYEIRSSSPPWAYDLEDRDLRLLQEVEERRLKYSASRLPSSFDNLDTRSSGDSSDASEAIQIPNYKDKATQTGIEIDIGRISTIARCYNSIAIQTEFDTAPEPSSRAYATASNLRHSVRPVLNYIETSMQTESYNKSPVVVSIETELDPLFPKSTTNLAEIKHTLGLINLISSLLTNPRVHVMRSWGYATSLIQNKLERWPYYLLSGIEIPKSSFQDVVCRFVYYVKMILKGIFTGSRYYPTYRQISVLAPLILIIYSMVHPSEGWSHLLFNDLGESIKRYIELIFLNIDEMLMVPGPLPG